MSYCSLSDVKLYLSIADGTDDTLLLKIIDSATAMITTITKRVFEAPVSDETRKYFTFGRTLEYSGAYNEICIDDDILSITSIKNYDGTTINLSNVFQLPFNTLPKNKLKLKASSGLNFGFCFKEDDYIEIVGKFAYSATPPEDIRHAAIRLVVWLYKQKDGGADLDRPIMTGEGTIVLPAHLPQDIELYLKPYIKENFS